MYSIKLIPEFSAWLSGVNDSMTHRRLARRLEKAQAGNLGDVKPVGEGVFEMREHFGPGWRMYYVQRGAALIVMLGRWRQVYAGRRYCQGHHVGRYRGGLNHD